MVLTCASSRADVMHQMMSLDARAAWSGNRALQCRQLAYDKFGGRGTYAHGEAELRRRICADKALLPSARQRHNLKKPPLTGAGAEAAIGRAANCPNVASKPGRVLFLIANRDSSPATPHREPDHGRLLSTRCRCTSRSSWRRRGRSASRSSGAHLLQAGAIWKEWFTTVIPITKIRDHVHDPGAQ